MNGWTLYAVFMLDNVRNLFTGVLALSFFVLFMTVAFYAAIIHEYGSDEGYATAMKVSRNIAIVCAMIALPSLLGVVFVPTTKQAAAIWLLPKIANNQQIQDLAGDSIDLLRQQVKKQLEETAK